jgi:hypothetical protein
MNETKNVCMIAKAASLENNDASTTDKDTGPSLIAKTLSMVGNNPLTKIRSSGANCSNTGSNQGSASNRSLMKPNDLNPEICDIVEMNDIGTVQKIHRAVVPARLNSAPTCTSL